MDGGLARRRWRGSLVEVNSKCKRSKISPKQSLVLNLYTVKNSDFHHRKWCAGTLNTQDFHSSRLIQSCDTVHSITAVAVVCGGEAADQTMYRYRDHPRPRPHFHMNIVLHRP